MIFQDLKITTKYPVVIVTLALLASMLTGILAYSTTSAELHRSSSENLTVILAARKSALENYFEIISEDLRIQSKNPLVLEALDTFSFSWHRQSEDAKGYFQKHYITENPFPVGERELLDVADDDSLYSHYHLKHHPVFRSLRNERGYYDIFLFDADGDLVYTVVKENDFATNFEKGMWRDTSLGRAFRLIKNSHNSDNREEQFFFDFEFYEPSQDKPASFVASALYGAKGEFKGVLAFQLPIDRLNFAMQDTAGMGKTGETIIVGRDLLRRSDSRFSDENLILKQKIETEVARLALEGKRGVKSYKNAAGEGVVAAFDFIEFQSVRWALIAEIEQSEILVPIQRMKQAMVIGFVFIAIIVTIVGFKVSRNLASPLVKMTEAMSRLTEGDLDSEVLFSGRKDEIGRMEKAWLVFRQTAIERAKSDQQLIEQTMLLQVVLENIAHGIALFDQNGQLLVWNKQYMEKTNLDGSLIVKGTKFIDLAEHFAKKGAYGQGDPKALAQARLDFFRSSAETRSEITFNEGEICEAFSKQTPDGGFVIVYIDVTQDRLQQQEILRQRDDLHLLNQQKNKFFSIIAHDLRNPFNALLGYSDYFKMNASKMSGEQVLEYADTIHQAAQQAYDLLENLLEWSRVQMNQIEYDPQTFEFTDMTTQVLKELATLIDEKDLKVKIESEPHMLIGDRNMTGTVLRNLIGNAIKFSNPGGKIELTSEKAEGFLDIYIRDNGVGIKEDILAKLFKEEAHQSTRGTAGEKGTGLGLLICRDFVEKQGGAIQVKSNDGEGTEIKVALPRAIPEDEVTLH
ncbi:PAS-domain containing protein [Kiloniella sp. EL199]|uniref:PAS-domain containing protein n=1 Tax=Kiloniella sp. EL199 TaxID=2107581 RepID=UPI000EA12488|nr:PAS-domain containing protein [Kiloniella sp. EL199]